MPESPNPTKNCPHCGQPMALNRSVCPNPECDYMSTWFKVRFFFGCAGALFAFIIIAIMTWMALSAPP